MNYENRRYLVIPSSVINQIDFTEVFETSSETLRKSIDESLTFVKYQVTLDENGDVLSGRPSIYNESYNEYTHSEIITLLSTSDWVDEIIEGDE